MLDRHVLQHACISHGRFHIDERSWRDDNPLRRVIFDESPVRSPLLHGCSAVSVGTEVKMELEVDRRELAVLIVDGQPLFRTALHGLVDAESCRVAEAASARAALELAEATMFDLAIVDAAVGGIALLAHLHALQPACRLLGVASDDNAYRVARMMRAGASACALKIQPADELVDAIRSAIDGVRYVPPMLRGETFDRLLTSDDEWPLDRLTPREREVFCLVADGGGNADIAAKLFISKRTVETHRQRIMTKLGARSLADLIKVARAYELA